MTMEASTIAPIAIAIPPNDIILAVMPCADITIKAARMANGNVIIATSADLACIKKINDTSATTIASSISLLLKYSIAPSIKGARSYTGTISTPSGSPS